MNNNSNISIFLSGIFVLSFGIVVSIVMYVKTNNELQETQTIVSQKENELEKLRGDLEAIQDSESLKGEEIKRIAAELKAREGELQAKEIEINTWKANTETTGKCLQGVVEALGLLDNGYYDDALVKLGNVEQPCEDAEDIIDSLDI